MKNSISTNSIQKRTVPFRILFRLRKSKKRPENGYVYLRLTVNRVRCTHDLATGIKVAVKDWDQRKQRIKGCSVKTQISNQILEEVCNRLNAAYLELLHNDKAITADRILELYQGRATVTLVMCMDELNYQQEKMMGNGIASKTMAQFKSRRNVIVRFLKEELKKDDLQLDEITKGTGILLQSHLKGRGYGQAHTNKIIQYFKRTLAFAFDNDYLKKNPLQYLKTSKIPEKQIEYIEPLEMKMIEAARLDEPLSRVRDMLLFACETGLAYVDMMAVNRESVAYLEGGLWLIGRRQKTQTQYAIPLTPKALDILEKHGYQLPRLCNTLYNKHLKTLAERAGINKRLHTHIGRSTKASMLVNAGVPENTVCRILGLKSIGVLRGCYAKLELKKVAQDMLQASKQIPMDNTVRPAIMTGFKLARRAYLPLSEG